MWKTLSFSGGETSDWAEGVTAGISGILSAGRVGAGGADLPPGNSASALATNCAGVSVLAFCQTAYRPEQAANMTQSEPSE